MLSPIEHLIKIENNFSFLKNFLFFIYQILTREIHKTFYLQRDF